jgi:putative membrane protein
MTEVLDQRVTDRRFFAFNGVVSALALSFLAWLLLAPRNVGGGADLAFMPAINASFNALSATLLTVGWFAIKQGKIELHKRLMVSAFASSALFLVGYIVYHYVHGDTKYQGQGAIRSVYFTILISHILLSIGIVPMALAAFYFALKERFVTHAKVARILLPIWLYVSVTGVVIYFMLKP